MIDLSSATFSVCVELPNEQHYITLESLICRDLQLLNGGSSAAVDGRRYWLLQDASTMLEALTRHSHVPTIPFHRVNNAPTLRLF